MQYQIDQSIKIEQTEKDTAIGLSNKRKFAVLIKRHTKRKLQEEFRRQGKPRLFVYRTFIAGVVLLLKYAKLKNVTTVTLDIEYYGKEKLLRSMFLEMWSRLSDAVLTLHFSRIGKASKAHIVSYQVSKGMQKANRILRYSEIKNLVLK